MKALCSCLVIMLAVSACCVKKECAEVNDVQLNFYSFTPSDLDTIYITGYEPGSDFTKVSREKRIDSARWYMNPDSTYNFPSKPYGLYYEQDWELYIPALNRTYRFTDYVYTDITCGCPHDKARSLERCSMNGVSYDLPVDIHK